MSDLHKLAGEFDDHLAEVVLRRCDEAEERHLELLAIAEDEANGLSSRPGREPEKRGEERILPALQRLLSLEEGAP